MNIFPQDVHQRIRLRRTLLAGGSAVILSILIWIAGEFSMVRLRQPQILMLLAVFWTGNLIFLGIIRSGANRRFRDPSLTMPQILWAITSVIYITYYVHDVRAAFLMICLLVINFGAFRLNLFQLIGIAVYATAGYALVVYLLHVNHPELFGLQLELFVLAGFAAALFGTTLVGHEMFVLRKTLRERNQQLETALKKVNRQAITDELTGLYNRRYIDDIIERNAALAQRGDFQFTVCFFDLDHFKEVNDTHGHAVGDDVLINIAKLASQSIRSGDILARYGGEEFMVILPATNLDSAAAVAERIRQAAEKSSVEASGNDIRVTISCGITGFRAPEPVETLLARADEAMYAAKEGGRNRVVRA